MDPIYVFYVAAGTAGLAVGSHQARPDGPRWVARIVAAGALLVTGLIGVATLFTGSEGGPLAAVGWFLLGWSLGVAIQHRW